MKLPRSKHFLPIILLLAVALFFFTRPRYASFSDWAATLTAEQIQQAHFAKNYGVEKISYDSPESEFPTIVTLLKSVAEAQCSREKAFSTVDEDYRLALFAQNKLWLFKCREDKTISLTFEDQETAKAYGCTNKSLIIRNEALWNYIITTVDTYGN